MAYVFVENSENFLEVENVADRRAAERFSFLI